MVDSLITHALNNPAVISTGKLLLKPITPENPYPGLSTGYGNQLYYAPSSFSNGKARGGASIVSKGPSKRCSFVKCLGFYAGFSPFS